MQINQSTQNQTRICIILLFAGQFCRKQGASLHQFSPASHRWAGSPSHAFQLTPSTPGTSNRLFVLILEGFMVLQPYWASKESDCQSRNMGATLASNTRLQKSYQQCQQCYQPPGNLGATSIENLLFFLGTAYLLQKPGVCFKIQLLEPGARRT